VLIIVFGDSGDLESGQGRQHESAAHTLRALIINFVASRKVLTIAASRFRKGCNAS
jgi:hypothetical protein